MKNSPTRRPGELGFTVLLLLFSMVGAWQAWLISGFASPSSPGVLPMIATFTMVVSGLVIVAGAARARPEHQRDGIAHFLAEVTPPRLIVFTLLIVAYMLALQPVGFVISSFAFLFAGMIYLHPRSILANLFISAGSLAIIYVVFRHVFSVVLPAGIFP